MSRCGSVYGGDREGYAVLAGHRTPLHLGCREARVTQLYSEHAGRITEKPFFCAGKRQVETLRQCTRQTEEYRAGLRTTESRSNSTGQYKEPYQCLCITADQECFAGRTDALGHLPSSEMTEGIEIEAPG